jgi:hypothetical protein
MPSIVYGGLRYTQIRHVIQCRKCLETIESKDIHDLKYCSCRAVAIDGGISAGNRILGNLLDIDERSIYCANVLNKNFWLPHSVVEAHFQTRKLILTVPIGLKVVHKF